MSRKKNLWGLTITSHPKTKLGDERKPSKPQKKRERETARTTEGERQERVAVLRKASSGLIHERQCLYYELKKCRFAGNLWAAK